jgi:hypothetical protein
LNQVHERERTAAQMFGDELAHVGIDGDQLHAHANACNQPPQVDRGRGGLQRHDQRCRGIPEQRDGEDGAAAIFIGETCEKECADEQAGKRRRHERAESRDAEEGRCRRGIEAAFDEAGAHVRGEKQVVEFEPAADGQQEHQHPDGTRRRQPVDARIDAERCVAHAGA